MKSESTSNGKFADNLNNGHYGLTLMADPITSMIKRINLPTRFTLVAMGLVIAIAVPLVQVYHNESAKMRVIRKEIAWSRYVRSILPLIESIENYQLASREHLAGIPAHRGTEYSSWKQIQVWSAKFNAVNKELAPQMGMARRWKVLHQQISLIPKNPADGQGKEVEELEDNAVVALWSLYSRATTEVKFSADRNPETQREIHALSDNLIELVEQTNMIQRAIIAERLRSHVSVQWRNAAIETAQLIDWRNISLITQNLRTPGELKTPQELALQESIRRLNLDGGQLLRSAQALAAGDPGSLPMLDRSADNINRDIRSVFTLSLGHMQSNLRARLSRLRLTLLFNIGLVICLIAVVGIIFYTTYRSLTGALQKKSLAERDLQQLNDLYATLSQINQLVAHRCPQHQLFEEVCRIITKSTHFELSFIAFTATRARHCRLGHWAGSAAEYLLAISHSQQKTLPAGLQPIDASLTSQSASVIHDFKTMGFDTPWAFALDKFHLRSAAAFPLLRKGHNFGVLAVYSSRPDGFSPRVVEVLSEIATSLTFAIEDADRESLRRAAEQALRDSEARYHLVMEAAGDAIILMQSDGRILEVNRRALELLGYTREEMLTLRGQQLFPPDVQGDTTNRYNRIINTGETVDSTTTITRKDLRSFPVEAVESRVEMQGKYMVLSIFRDISERKAAEERIHYLAYHDSLTGLPNRTLLIDRLEQAIREAHRRNTMAGVVFIDLDNFKSVNDTLGHDFGDELLQGAAMRIRSALRSEDTVARLGGDEFIVLIKEPRSPGDVNLVAQKIIQSMSVPFVISGHTFHISCSIGMSIYPRDGVDCGVLLRTADEALYQVKKEGKNRAAFHTPEMHAAAIEHIRLENDLREALRKNQFVLQFQPQVNLQTGKIIGSEALIRWQHPDRGLVSPMKFIPLAEEKGLILEIGEWILHEACAQNRRWQTAGVPIVPVAVNLSALQCREPGLPEIVRRTLRDTGLDPGMLELEITESTLMAQTESLRSRMIEIKDCGIHFSLDDFGTGYSSLSYLTRFPIDTLKIDRTFIRDMIDDPKDLAVVDTIVNLAENLQLKTIAEGVEKIEQITLLKLLGCHSIQGYFFSKPVHADELAKLLSGDIRLPTAQSSTPRAIAV